MQTTDAIKRASNSLSQQNACRRDLLYGPRRHIRKEWTESFDYRRVDENGVSEPPIWQGCPHRRFHPGDDLAGLGTNHCEAKNAVVAATDKNLHEALCLIRRLCPQHSAHRQPRDAHADALALRFAFAESHMGEWRVREQAVWNLPVARAALPSGQIVPDNSEVVDGYVRELWATGTFPHGPDTGRSRLQLLIDANVATIIQLNAGLLKPEPCGVRNAPRRDQYVAALDLLLTGGCAHGKADFLSGSAVHIEGLSRH